MDVVDQLGQRLREVGFDTERALALRQHIGGVPPPDALSALGRLDDASLAIVMLLFNGGQVISYSNVEQALGAQLLDGLQAERLVEVDDSGVRARVHLAPFDGLIVAGDPNSQLHRSEFVLTFTQASETSAYFTIRRPVDSALDLGTGSGVQALLASRHANRVTGIDINPRALSFARLSQRLNGAEGVTWLEGSWSEPVRGQRFDLVVANPPYVISPDSALAYRESGSGGDEVSRQVVRESAERLEEGGFATVLCSWIHDEAEAWERALSEWVGDLGCDAVLVLFSSQEPLVYAMYWNQDLRAENRARFDEVVSRWLTHYKNTGVQRIASGVVVLRRRSSGSNWTRAFKADHLPTAPGRDQLEQMFAGADFLARYSGAEQLHHLLSGTWRLIDGHRLHQMLLYHGGNYGSGDAVMTLEPGLGISARLDTRVIPVLVACVGKRRLGELIQECPAPENLDQGAFHKLCLDAARDLIARGFLVGP